MGAVRLAQLTMTILFSTDSVSELLKFCELGDKRFETLSKKDRRILRSNAGIHDTPSNRVSGRILPLSRPGKLCNHGKSAPTYGMLRPQKRCSGASRRSAGQMCYRPRVWPARARGPAGLAARQPIGLLPRLRIFYRLESVALEIRVLAPGQSALRFSSFSSSAQSTPPFALGIPEPPPVAKGPFVLPPPAPTPPLPPAPPPDVPPA